MNALKAVGPQVTNGAVETLELSQPYTALVTVQGTADLIFHRWNVEGVEAKSKAAKGSKAKKTDDIESYVYRDESGALCIPGENFRQSAILAAKYRQDPRSPRKSAMDLYKAGVVATTPLASLGITEWDYEHKARVQVQRNGITRVRPAIRSGWKVDLTFLVLTPEYIRPDDLHDTLMQAGRLVGVCDFRPTYGRFSVVAWSVASA